MHRIAEIVAGPDYGDRLVMMSCTMDRGCIDRALELLDANGMGFRKDLDGGIVIGFGWPAEHCSQLEIITLAPDADRALQIEQRFIALLTQSMKKRKSGSDDGKGGDSPSQLIDARIEALSDWRGETLARVRTLIKQADPEVVEEWKWRGVPVWSHAIIESA